jgi:hypothetical protein
MATNRYRVSVVSNPNLASAPAAPLYRQSPVSKLDTLLDARAPLLQVPGFVPTMGIA